MGTSETVIGWFAGNGRYHDLVHCMGRDTPWIVITIVLDLAVAVGYGVIAAHWWTNERLLPARAPARLALRNMRNIFLFCGICGYIFIPVKMVWPAWRLYDFFMLALAYFTWRYAWSAKDLKVVYSELGRSSKLEADLERSREESRRKSLFLNALGHDLRTPLNGLMLQANLAEMSVNQDPDALVAALREVKSCARATSELLDSLLEYAKLDRSDEPNVNETFDLDAVLQDVMHRFSASAAEKRLSLRLGESVRGLRVRTDRVKLERILSNLLGNAIKFTEHGEVRVETQRAGDGLEIHVIDSGIGIDPAHRERLFEEFYQVHNHERDPRKGFGLGLSIARRLSRQLGGDVQLDSAVGSGSRFSVVLPGVVGGDGLCVARGTAGDEPGAKLRRAVG